MNLNYDKAGVNLGAKHASFEAMQESLKTSDARVMNRFGAFASMIDIHFPEYNHPVLLFKLEEPGTKQMLAFAHGRIDGICQDLINHLVNDIIVMGARPLAVQDLIICGKLEKETVTAIVDHMAQACRAQECSLVGGETSEQPGAIGQGEYILGASIIGVAEKDAIIDGSRIKPGDAVLNLPSNGLHTNGYSLARMLLREKPEIADEVIEGESFVDVLLRPHTPYYGVLKDLFMHEGLHGMAHITGGGMHDNLLRILPEGCRANLDLNQLDIPEIFKVIRRYSGSSDADMMSAFNLGAGMLVVVSPESEADITAHITGQGTECTKIGTIDGGERGVAFTGELGWEG